MSSAVPIRVVEAEAAVAAAVAAVEQLKDRLQKEERVVVSLTGHGLKATSRVEKIPDNI